MILLNLSMKNKILKPLLRIILILLCSGTYLYGQQDSVKVYNISTSEKLIYKKPKLTDVVKNFGGNALNTAKDVISKEYYPYSLAAIGTTAILIPTDPFFNRNARSLGQEIGFTYDHKFEKLGPLKIVPGNVNSLLYFLGNGTAVILMSGGFAAYGLLKNDYRAQSVSLQLVQSILLTGLYTQTLKRITGRESPFVTTEEGRIHSNWAPFPSFGAYQKDTSRYDAMPSGHLTTGLAAWIIIAENYPEYKWIKPVGFTILGLMSLEMMQSGVHWISDYPIAILLGYLIGKNIARNSFKKEKSTPFSKQKKYHFNLSTSTLAGYRLVGVGIDF